MVWAGRMRTQYVCMYVYTYIHTYIPPQLADVPPAPAVAARPLRASAASRDVAVRQPSQLCAILPPLAAAPGGASPIRAAPDDIRHTLDTH